MGAKISTLAVKCNVDDTTSNHLFDVCTNVIQGDWTNYVDLRSKIVTAARMEDIVLDAVSIEDYNVSTTNRINVYSNDFNSYGDNYLVIRRSGGIFHYNFRVIITW